MAPETVTAEPQLFLEKLKLGVTGTIVLMFCRMWDVYDATGRYLSTDFVVCDSKGSTMHANAHNFLKLKEGGIYSVKNFAMQPNKDEFRVIKNATFMLELDGATNNKYLIDVAGYVTNVSRIVQQKTGSKTLDFHLANFRTSSTLILDDEEILEVKQLKADSSGAEFSKEIPPDSVAFRLIHHEALTTSNTFPVGYLRLY
ncbi:hypothetical protein Tco_1411606, partial [Tanacetum coccineum]